MGQILKWQSDQGIDKEGGRQKTKMRYGKKWATMVEVIFKELSIIAHFVKTGN